MGVGDRVDNNARPEDPGNEVEMRFGDKGEEGVFDESRGTRFVLISIP